MPAPFRQTRPPMPAALRSLRRFATPASLGQGISSAPGAPGELEKANEALESALKISPNAFTPLVNHGIVLVRLKKYAEAEELLVAELDRKEQL